MKSLGFGRIVLGIGVAAAMKAGCGGLQAPIGGVAAETSGEAALAS